MIRIIVFVSTLALIGMGVLHYAGPRGIAGEPEFESIDTEITQLNPLFQRFPELINWERPTGPLRVGIQVGHWKNSELPDELERLRGTSTGAVGGGTTEVAVNLAIAEELAEILEAEGIIVDIIPATVPPSYWADLFLAIHADGNTNPQKSGFKATGPWRDFTNTSSDFVSLFYETYADTTGIPIDETITRNMRGYYAFNWWRNTHAIHPMTTAVIVETGFLTSAQDRRIIVDAPEKAAQGIAQAVFRYFEKHPIP